MDGTIDGEPTALLAKDDIALTKNADISAAVSVVTAPLNLPPEERDHYLVDFEGPDDPSNPLNWSSASKWLIVTMISMMTLVGSLATVICTLISPLILREIRSENSLYGTILVSIWEIGLVFGPLLIGPLSELYGRFPVNHGANVLFVAFSVGNALSVNLNMLIAFRFLNGMSMASLTLNPGIVGDIFIQEERGGAIAILSMFPLIGLITGPVIGGFIAQRKGWRWAFWMVTFISAACEICFIFWFRESYKVRILQQKAEQKRKETGSEAYRSKYDTGVSASQLFKQSIIRPTKLLVFSPIVLLLSIYVSIVYGYLYLLLTTLAMVFQDIYNFAEGPVGLTFLGIGIGMTIGLFLCRATLDQIVRRKKATEEGMRPRFRLQPMTIGGATIPIGLLLYGWTARPQIHWILPIIGTGLVGFGQMVTTIPTYSYLVDAFPLYAASSLVLRSLTGTLLPLAGPPLYSSLGIAWGNSLLGFIALVFTPVPLLLIRFGEHMRKSSKFSRTMTEM